MSAEDYVLEVQLDPASRLDRVVELIRSSQDTMSEMLGRELEIRHVQAIERSGRLFLRIQWNSKDLQP